MEREEGSVSELLTVRYHSGVTEYRVSEKTPAVGDVLSRNGAEWIVQEVIPEEDGSAVVTLRPTVDTRAANM